MQISLPLIRRHRSPPGTVAAVLAVLAAILLAAPTQANPYFATQTGRQCSSCHQQGRETEGIRGLTRTGRAFEQAFRTCPTCALQRFSGQMGNRGGRERNAECRRGWTTCAHWCDQYDPNPQDCKYAQGISSCIVKFHDVHHCVRDNSYSNW